MPGGFVFWFSPKREILQAAIEGFPYYSGQNNTSPTYKLYLIKSKPGRF